MLKRSKDFIAEARSLVDDFLQTGPIEELVLTLDGPGVNGSIQYLVLTHIGIERLRRFKTVNILSASTYAYLCFLAKDAGDLLWDKDNYIGWDAFNRRAHNVRVGTTLLHVLGSFAGLKPPLPNLGFEKALTGTIASRFLAKKVASLPTNARIWLYNNTKNEFEFASSGNQFASQDFADIIRAAPAVPKVFAPHQIGTDFYSDPVYAPKVKEFYKSLRSEQCVSHLFSNVKRSTKKHRMIYVRPQPYLNGSAMLIKDLGLFLGNVPNRDVHQAMKVGLFMEEQV